MFIPFSVAKDHVHKALVIFIYAASIIGVILLVVRGCHLFLPEDCCWLTDTRIQEIDKLIFSGAIGGGVGAYLKSQIK